MDYLVLLWLFIENAIHIFVSINQHVIVQTILRVPFQFFRSTCMNIGTVKLAVSSLALNIYSKSLLGGCGTTR